MVGKGGLEPPQNNSTRSLVLRVYQFRHSRRIHLFLTNPSVLVNIFRDFVDCVTVLQEQLDSGRYCHCLRHRLRLLPEWVLELEQAS